MLSNPSIPSPQRFVAAACPAVVLSISVFLASPLSAQVFMREGYETADQAAFAGLRESVELAKLDSTRPDGRPETEYGGVVYRAADGSYGYVSPHMGEHDTVDTSWVYAEQSCFDCR